MIGKISGRLDYRAEDHVLIDTGGVGYVVFCAEPVLATMPRPGEPIALYTELVVREDLLQLFGFRTRAEREWHRLLTSVQGVGAKVGLAIVGALGPDGVARALSLGDAATMRRVPGVGPKLATRIVTELKDKAPALLALGQDGAQAATVSGIAPETPPASPEALSATKMAAPAQPQTAGADVAQARADALSALVNLGYQQGEAASALTSLDDTLREAPEMIRAALRALAPRE